MNKGEREELLFKLALVYKRDNNIPLFGNKIESVSFNNEEYLQFPKDVSLAALTNMNDNQLINFAKHIGINKSPAKAKADVYINGVGVSLKYSNAAPSSIVNHTSRPGFEFACNQSNVSIDILDDIINEYWKLKEQGIIKEDTCISDANCPFKNYKEYLRPLLEYFLFNGTGSRLSTNPAEYIINFSDFFDENTYTKLNRINAVDEMWEKLVFSLRSKKGMPKNYDINTYVGINAQSIAKWCKYFNNNYKGALHIRIKK